MGIQPTCEQQKIISYSSNCVVIAKPGSGKTFTLSQKIKKILPELPHYGGVIAISFTNKASSELERRCITSGVDMKNSFFGTIDSFFLTEVIIPFGTHIFGKPTEEISILKLEDLYKEDPHKHEIIKSSSEITENNYSIIGDYFQKGQIILETIGPLAIYVFAKSVACRRYLRARYSYIFIDEYQDCGKQQHDLFIRLVDSGLIGVAVGDIDQSIFEFAGKDSKYLLELSSDSNRFFTFPLSENHRCHSSIINYSSSLLSKNFNAIPSKEIRVFRKFLEGSEIEIADWISTAVQKFSNKFDVKELNKIGILFKNRQTGNIVHKNLQIQHKPIVTTPLDTDSSMWGSVFRKVLFLIFNPDTTKYEFLERCLSIDYQRKTVVKVSKLLRNIELIAHENPEDLIIIEHLFHDVASNIYPNCENRETIIKLRKVLQNKMLLSSFIPAKKNEVQLLSLHKAKGLEFDIVFHLNLYKWILPQYQGNYIQDLNLHYVGITRAKQGCVLCVSSHRHNSNNEIIKAEESEFCSKNDVKNYRIDCTY